MYYSKQILQHKQDRWNLVQKSRAILDRAERDGVPVNSEERAELDGINAAIADHEQRIADLEKYNDAEEPSEVEGDEMNVERSRRVGRSTLETRGGDYLRSPEYRRIFNHYLKTGEKRDVIVGTNTQGGYLITPTQVSEDIVKQLDNLLFFRQLCPPKKLNNAQSLGQRQITSRLGDPTMMTEVASTVVDTILAFGRRDLTPNLASRTVLVSDKELELSEDIVGLVGEELSYKFAALGENKYINGSGSGEPLGIFTASANGIPTSQDVTSGTAGDFTADDLFAMRYGLPAQYFRSPNMRWMIGRPIAKKIRTLKDSYGQYLWQPGLMIGAKDMLLDVEVCQSEYAPTAVTSGSYVAVLGDFNYYRTVEVSDIQIRRLDELYAGNHQVGFRGTWFFDGSPVLSSAFCRLKVQ